MIIWLILFWAALALLLYVHAGYPALMALLARKPQPPEDGDQPPASRPRVAVVIAALNEEAVVASKLENALQLNYPRERLQVVLASDGSTDRTVEIARRFEPRGVHVLDFAENRGKASVLNDAIGQVEADVVCLCDANVMFRPDALGRLVRCLDDPRLGAVSGDVRLASHESNFGEGEAAFYDLERRVQLGESRIGSMMGVDGGMYVLPRDLYRPLPADTILDDFVISMRVIQQGRRVAYEPAAVATENGTPRARQEFRRRMRVAAGAVQSLKRGQWPPLRRPVELWQYLSHKLLRWLGPVLLAVLLAASAALWNQGPFYRAVLLAQAAGYAVAAACTPWLALRQTRIGGVFFYFAMSHVAMAVGLLKGLLFAQRGAWSRTERTPGPPAGKVDLELTSDSL